MSSAGRSLLTNLLPNPFTDSGTDKRSNEYITQADLAITMYNSVNILIKLRKCNLFVRIAIKHASEKYVYMKLLTEIQSVIDEKRRL